MPIASPIVLRPISQQEFAAIDYRVMRAAFASQNELGRLCDEVIYQNDLATRLAETGLGAVRTEVPITVTHRTFSKTYFLDLVVGDSAIYELKVAARLAPEHEAQLMNYLFLEGVQHGKLVNFRPAQVHSRFVNTTLTPDSRRQIALDSSRWEEEDEASKHLRLVFSALLDDWGGFLELPLYTEALTHFLGGEDRVIQPVPLTRAGMLLGSQRLRLLAPDIAFRVTAMAEVDAVDYEHGLRSLLAHSPLRVIQWVNLIRHRACFATLKK